MQRHWDILVAGAGPGGLACATLLARGGKRVLVLERRQTIGPKVCAGGITWDGLIKRVPESLVERSFSRQYIVSAWQRTCIRAPNPIVATVSRTHLGQWMADRARAAGVTILTSTRVVSVDRTRLTAVTGSGHTLELQGEHLVGADGSASLIRRSLGLPIARCGMGIDYQIRRSVERMEWHLHPRFFGSGYGWIFPHRETVSIGAYVPRGNLAASRLRQGLLQWAAAQGYDLGRHQGRAGLINFDYRGYRFGNTWLVGDAAGLASGLTGEGIYPALTSGENVARMILSPDHPDDVIQQIVRKQRLHNRVLHLAARSPLLSFLLMEGLVLLLRTKVLDFHTLEMAD